MKAHEKAFAEIKNYYNDITHNNLDLIRSLKEEVRVPSPEMFDNPSIWCFLKIGSEVISKLIRQTTHDCTKQIQQ